VAAGLRERRRNGLGRQADAWSAAQAMANSLPRDTRNIRRSLQANTRQVRRSQVKWHSCILASELPLPP
jgi:hypothetical protein